ncbi:MAG: hypothetical protein Kow0075_12170 [Salibacteraceae bacterium]
MKHRLKIATAVILASLVWLSVQHFLGDEMVSFTAYANDKHVRIQWTARAREQISLYLLERSSDGKSYEVFKQVPNESSGPASADFIETDFKPYPGWSYYRIRVVDNQGHESYTHSVPVFYGIHKLKSGTVMVPPRPGSTDKGTKIDLNRFNGQYAVFVLRDQNGQEFYFEAEIRVENNQLLLPTGQGMEPGQYVITACSKDPLVGSLVFLQ